MGRSDILRIWLPAVLVALLGCVLTYVYLVEPPPERTLVLATASEDGAYHAFGQRYQAILRRAGFDLRLRTTGGSVENLELLRAPDSGVDMALVQSGVGGPDSGDGRPLQGLASAFREPLWIFHRGGGAPDTLPELIAERPNDESLRVAVGGPGSGTRAVVEQLLRINGMASAPFESVAIGGEAAAEALIAGEVDVAMFVVAPEADSYLYTRLVAAMRSGESPIRLMNMDRSESYVRRLPFLSSVFLPRGLLDLAHDLPPRDIELIAPTATLVAREDLHPAIIYLMLEALTETHGAGNLLDAHDEFPSRRYLDFPINRTAQRYLENGPSFLYQVFPFGVAASFDRLKVMLLPLLTLVVPLFKVIPPVYRWQIRSRIFRWYGVLREADMQAGTVDDAERLQAQLERIEKIEEELPGVKVPLSYMEEFYHLRLHLGYIRERLEKAIDRLREAA